MQISIQIPFFYKQLFSDNLLGCCLFLYTKKALNLLKFCFFLAKPQNCVRNLVRNRTQLLKMQLFMKKQLKINFFFLHDFFEKLDFEGDQSGEIVALNTSLSPSYNSETWSAGNWPTSQNQRTCGRHLEIRGLWLPIYSD